MDIIYFDALRNSDTDMIDETLPVIIGHLMKKYGKVTLEDIYNKE